MRLLTFSDLHLDLSAARRLASLALGANPTALVSCGDLGLDGTSSPEVYASFRHAGVPVLAVPGNHDGEAAYPAALEAAGWRDLHGKAFELEGWTLAGHGLPRQEPAYYGPRTGGQREDPALTDLLRRLEAVVTSRLVLVTHLPPWGTLASRDRHFKDWGSMQLRKWIEDRQPAAVLCGHVHHREAVLEQLGKTTVVNAGPSGYVLTL